MHPLIISIYLKCIYFFIMYSCMQAVRHLSLDFNTWEHWHLEMKNLTIELFPSLLFMCDLTMS